MSIVKGFCSSAVPYNIMLPYIANYITTKLGYQTYIMVNLCFFIVYWTACALSAQSLLPKTSPKVFNNRHIFYLLFKYMWSVLKEEYDCWWLARYLKYIERHWTEPKLLLTVMSTSSSPIQSPEDFHKKSMITMVDHFSLRKHIPHRPFFIKAFQKFLDCRHVKVGFVYHILLRFCNFLYGGTYIKQLWVSISITLFTLNNIIIITTILSYHSVNT